MNKLLTIEQLKEELGLPLSWIYARTRPKCPPGERIPHHKFGRHLRFDLERVKQWAAERGFDGESDPDVGLRTRRPPVKVTM